MLYKSANVRLLEEDGRFAVYFHDQKVAHIELRNDRYYWISDDYKGHKRGSKSLSNLVSDACRRMSLEREIQLRKVC